MLNENIKDLRTKNGWSQNEFGSKVGMSASYVSQIESNPDYNPAINKVAEIAETFGVSIDYLYYGEEYSNVDKLQNEIKEIEERLDKVKQAIPQS